LCCRLGRLSFSIYLLHFPILFTLGCAGFMALADFLPNPAAIAVTFVGFVLVLLIAASGFERWVDRPAIRLSRRLDTAFPTSALPALAAAAEGHDTRR
jgi:peptidoglycan/LPS O-acetylase OafA/YrhL